MANDKEPIILTKQDYILISMACPDLTYNQLKPAVEATLQLINRKNEEVDATDMRLMEHKIGGILSQCGVDHNQMRELHQILPLFKEIYKAGLEASKKS